MSDWRRLALGDAVEINPKERLNRESLVPFIEMAALEGNARSHARPVMRENPSGSRFRDGDTLLARITPSLENGKTAQVSGLGAGVVGVGSTEFIVLRGRQGLSDSSFVYYLARLPSFREFAVAQMTGTSGRQRVQVDALAGLEVLLPSVTEQRAIAGVLGALDDKIESNRRTVELLEALGRAELASALAGPDGEPWESAWPEVPLGEVLSLIETGDRPKGGVGQIEHGIPSIGAESIIAPGVFDFSKTKFIPQEYFEGMRRGILESGDVLLYKDGGTPGNFIPKVSMCQDGFPFEVAAINSHVYRLRVAEPYSQAFLYFWLSSPRMLDEMWLRGTGAAIPSLNSTNVKGLPFPTPPAERLTSVIPVVDEMMSRLHQAALEERTLAQLRDALLPELLSGRMRVRDAEQAVSEAV